jgi:hypothetical protein
MIFSPWPAKNTKENRPVIQRLLNSTHFRQLVVHCLIDIDFKRKLKTDMEMSLFHIPVGSNICSNFSSKTGRKYIIVESQLLVASDVLIWYLGCDAPMYVQYHYGTGNKQGIRKKKKKKKKKHGRRV